MEKNTIKNYLEKSIIAELKRDFSEKEGSNLEKTFKRLGSKNHEKLLRGFCTEYREVYDENPFITEVGFVDEAEAWIGVNFTGSVYFGCDDMNKVYEHDEVVSCLIINESLVLFETRTPVLEMREPDL